MNTQTHVPRFLASVTSPAEALTALAGGAQIIDAKNPAEGALGALPVATVRAIREALPPDVTLSATVGDLPCDAVVVCDAVEAMSSSGANIIKVGFFPGGDPKAVIAALAGKRSRDRAIVGLLLVDRQPDFGLVKDMAEAGFAGVMVDTAGKSGGSLTEHMTLPGLTRFIEAAHGLNLFAGLAGSLAISDLPRLMALKPDVLGFRGALCGGDERTNAIEAARVRAVRNAMDAALNQHRHRVRANAN